MIELLIENQTIRKNLVTNTNTALLTSDDLEIDVEYIKELDTSYNGIVLNPISCVLNQELNGVWELELVNGLDDKFDYITENGLLRVDIPNFKKQLYRIASIEKTDTQIRALAYPIFLDASTDVFLYDNRPTDLNGQDALNWMMAGTKYSGQSNIIGLNTAYYINKNLIEAIMGDIDQSFLNRWGGEILYDNYKIIINYSAGSDNNVRVETGFNLVGINESINTDDVATRLVPTAYNGYMLPEKYVDSSRIDNYPKKYIKVLDCSDLKLTEDCSTDEEGYDTLEELYEAMRLKCQLAFDNGADLPTISYDIDMVDLSHTDEYKKYSALTNVSLGDIVHCHHKRLDIDVDAKVIKLTWDCIYQEVTSLTLGDYESDYFENITNASKSTSNLEEWLEAISDKDDRTLIAEKIEGAIDGYNAQITAQKSVGSTADVRAILFEDLNTDADTYGALSIGTQGFAISNTRNATDTDWEWTTIGTGSGLYATAIYGNEITGLVIDGGELYFGDNDSAYAHLYGGNTSSKEYLYFDTFGGGGEHHRLFDRGLLDIRGFNTSHDVADWSTNFKLSYGLISSTATNYSSTDGCPRTDAMQLYNSVSISGNSSSSTYLFNGYCNANVNYLARYEDDGTLSSSIKEAKSSQIIAHDSATRGIELCTYASDGSTVAHAVEVYDAGTYIDDVLVDFKTGSFTVEISTAFTTTMTTAYVNNYVCSYTASVSLVTDSASANTSIGSIPTAYRPPKSVYTFTYCSSLSMMCRIELNTSGYILLTPYGGNMTKGSSVSFTLTWLVKN